jgi:hypothetical protein
LKERRRHLCLLAGANAVARPDRRVPDAEHARPPESLARDLSRLGRDPLTGSTNPIADLKRAFRQFVREDIESGAWLQGCPLNNLAQEMSPLDEGFRKRIDGLYARWRKCFAAALADGIEAHKVRKDASPRNVAALIVAAQMGIWGTAKNSQSKELTVQAVETLCDYLDDLKP